MSTQVQYRRGTEAQNNAFTGALAEITVDTTNLTLRVHDGINAGGSNIATVAYVDNVIGSLSANSITDGTSNVRIVSTNGNAAISVAGTANVLVVTATGADVTGNVVATGDVVAQNFDSVNADMAEIYRSDDNYAPGTVVVFGGKHEITVSTQSHTAAVAGVISTNPAYLMNSEADGLPVALQGRVPCRVVGKIAKGDRLVASDQPGVATVLDLNCYEPGCIIGKALEDYDSDQEGTIEVVAGRV